jgi:glutamate N-acetyltransferase/amino-acid N-acetyltransferase
LDLGLIATDRPVPAAGVFSTNRVLSAAAVVARSRAKAGRLQAITANSGCANSFTGKRGMKLAIDSCKSLAGELRCGPEFVAPCSTGVIGHLYDLERYASGVRAAVSTLSEDGLEQFARAIMTTDTMPKIVSTSLRLSGVEVAIAGCAKGAGMIEPHMATMLAFIVTDAAVPAAILRAAIRTALPHSFNAITIDGDMSTNDTLLVMASGGAGNRTLRGRDLARFADAFNDVSCALARGLVYDGEGATKLVKIEVHGAGSDADAEKAARKIANSPLVKTAFFGCDPNVGRILMAAGGSGAMLDSEKLDLSIDGVKIAARGALLVQALPAAAQRMRRREFGVCLDLKLGKGSATILTSDLSYEYVKINAEYTT